MPLNLSCNPHPPSQKLLTLLLVSTLLLPELLTVKLLCSHSRKVVSSFGLSLVLSFASSVPALSAFGNISKIKRIQKINSTKLKTTMLESESEIWKNHSKKSLTLINFTFKYICSYYVSFPHSFSHSF